VSEVTGIEGEWAGEWFSEERMRAEHVELIFANLEDELSLARVFDLAVCIEVIEHLSPARGESFVRDLCRCAPYVLFGAAIPGQGGMNHINERWPSHWARCFAQHGFRPLDIIRPRVWGDADLWLQYRQNLILFVHDDVYADVVARAAALPSPAFSALDHVHPSLYSQHLDELRAASTIGLRRRAQLAAGIPRAALNRLGKSLRR
jgi:hypothetical protein